MDIAVMQPYLFPYIGYFQMINCADVFVNSDNVQYITKGWINRNRILVNGEAHLVTLPVIRDSAYLNINERYFKNDSNKNGRNQLLMTIDFAYRKAPNFNECYELVEGILNFCNNNVAEFIYNSLTVICSYLNIKTPILIKSELDVPSELERQDSIIYVVKKLNADRYINAIGGKEIYSAKKFRDNGLTLKFIKTRETLKYKQYNNNFVSGLSIIDVMMFNSREEIQKLLMEYDLVDGKN